MLGKVRRRTMREKRRRPGFLAPPAAVIEKTCDRIFEGGGFQDISNQLDSQGPECGYSSKLIFPVMADDAAMAGDAR